MASIRLRLAKLERAVLAARPLSAMSDEELEAELRRVVREIQESEQLRGDKPTAGEVELERQLDELLRSHGLDAGGNPAAPVPK